MNAQPKFTPGPWETRLKTMSVQGRLHVAVSAGNYPTAFTPAWDRPEPGEVDGTDEALANASLIAAAPEMYEALSKLVTQTKLLGVAMNTDLEPFVALGEAVLAKAEGRQP